MTAPVASTRIAPVGIMLENGYRSLITFAADTNVSLWEIDVTPPGMDGGDAIDTTTMWNNSVRTKAPRALKTITDGSINCGYDPVVKTQLLALVNVNTTITITYPDGSTEAFFGFLKAATPNSLAEGTLPQMACTFVATNSDPIPGTEQVPVIVEVAGT